MIYNNTCRACEKNLLAAGGVVPTVEAIVKIKEHREEFVHVR
jgi:hypothetical protein